MGLQETTLSDRRGLMALTGYTVLVKRTSSRPFVAPGADMVYNLPLAMD